MRHQEVIKERLELGGYKVIRRQSIIETLNNLNQVIHFIDLSYTQADIFYHGWVGYRTNDQMKDILTGHFKDIFKEHPTINMLTDCSKMKGSFMDLNNWYVKNFIPELTTLGLKNNANIFPTETSAQIAVKDWNDKVQGINNMTFFSLNEALSWLALL
jgi:hypothetical protein